MPAPSIRAGATYAASAASTSHSVSKPTGTVQGDLLVFAGIFPANPTCPTVNSLPSGWSQLWQDQVTAAAKWAKLVSSDSAQFNLASNKAGSSAAQTAASYWADDLGPDVEAYLTIDTNVAIAGDNFRVHARLQQAGGAGTQDGYQVRAQQVSGAANDTIIIDRVTNNANTALATYTQEFAAGDKIGIRCVGNVIQAWYKASAGSWTKLGEVTDSTYSAAGKVGMAVRGTTGKIDNFYAGTVTDGGASAFGAFASLLDDFNRENETPLTGPPPGKFTFFVATKRAGASEPSSYTFGCNISNRPTGSILAIKDTAGIDVSNRATNVGAETDYATPSITPNDDRALILAFYGAFANGSGSALTFTPDAAFTEYHEAENGIHVSIETQYLTQTSAASVSGTATGSISTNFQAAGIIAFKATPANDYFADRETISGESGSTDPVDLTYCTLETGESGYAGERQTIWYEWTNELSETRQVVFTATFSPGANWGTLIVTKANAVNEIFSPGNLVIQRAAYGTTVIGQFDAQPGETYKIQLGVTSVFSGTVSLSWSTNPAGPSNDDFANRISITDETGSTDVVDPTYATIETDEASLNGFKSVWWEFTAPTKGVYSFTPIIDSGTAYSMQLGGYIGSSLASLVSQGSGSTDGTNTYPLGIILDADDVIQLRVAQWYVTDNPTFHFSWTYEGPPVNDDFADRITISGSDSSVAGTTIGATFEVGEPQYYGSDFQSVWYEWVAPADGNYLLETTKGANNASHYTSVFTGDSVDALTEILTATDWGVLTATAGTVYKIRIGAFYTPGSADLYAGAFTFTWKPAIPATTTPSYDNIADAYILVQDGTQYTTPQLTLYGATMETNEETQGEGFGGIWLKIDLSNPIYYDPAIYVDIPYTLTPFGGTSAAYIDVYAVTDQTFDSSNPDFSMLQSVDGSNQDMTGTLSLLPSDSVTGIFYVWVGNYSWNPYETGGTTFTYNIPGPSIPPPVPTNTDCASAIELTGLAGSVVADNRAWDGVWPGNANDPLFQLTDEYGSGSGGAPLWYKWTNTSARRAFLRLTMSVPGVHAIPYYSIAMAPGSCGALDFIFNDNDFDRYTISGTNRVGQQTNPIWSQLIDRVVEPGATIYIEMDSMNWDYAGDGSDPPVNTLTDRGILNIAWEVFSVTFYDSIDYSELLTENVSELSGGYIEEIADGIQANGRYYFTWIVSNSSGHELWAGDCLPDGTDLHTYRIATNNEDYWAHRIYTSATLVRMCTDGSRVWLGFPLSETIINPDDHAFYPSYIMCEGYGLTEWTLYRNRTTTQQYAVAIYEIQSDHTWNLYYLLHRTDVSVGPFPTSPINYNEDHELNSWAMSAAPTSPGDIWLSIAYQGARFYVNDYWNDYPSCGMVHNDPETSRWGSIEVVTDQTDMHIYFDVYKIPDGEQAELTFRQDISHNVTYLVEYRNWVNPAFGNTVIMGDGPWLTTGETPLDAGDTFAMWIVNDTPDGTPIIAFCRRTSVIPSYSPYDVFANTITFMKQDGTVIAEIPFSEFDTAGAHTATDTFVMQNCIYLSETFLNPKNNNAPERFISTRWQNMPLTFTGDFINRLPTDINSHAPLSIEAGYDYLNYGSNREEFGRSWYADKTRNVWHPVPYGSQYRSWISQYDFLCNHVWQSGWPGYNEQDPRLEWPYGTTFQLQRGYWDSGEPPYVVLFDTTNCLRKYTVKRDYYICAIGPPAPCPPSVFWFYRDGQWRQQNVDTEHSLYVYINGEWVQDCRELKGRLDEQWQN